MQQAGTSGWSGGHHQHNIQQHHHHHTHIHRPPQQGYVWTPSGGGGGGGGPPGEPPPPGCEIYLSFAIHISALSLLISGQALVDAPNREAVLPLITTGGGLLVVSFVLLEIAGCTYCEKWVTFPWQVGYQRTAAYVLAGTSAGLFIWLSIASRQNSDIKLDSAAFRAVAFAVMVAFTVAWVLLWREICPQLRLKIEAHKQEQEQRRKEQEERRKEARGDGTEAEGAGGDGGVGSDHGPIQGEDCDCPGCEIGLSLGLLLLCALPLLIIGLALIDTPDSEARRAAHPLVLAAGGPIVVSFVLIEVAGCKYGEKWAAWPWKLSTRRMAGYALGFVCGAFWVMLSAAADPGTVHSKLDSTEFRLVAFAVILSAGGAWWLSWREIRSGLHLTLKRRKKERERRQEQELEESGSTRREIDDSITTATADAGAAAFAWSAVLFLAAALPVLIVANVRAAGGSDACGARAAARCVLPLMVGGGLLFLGSLVLLDAAGACFRAAAAAAAASAATATAAARPEALARTSTAAAAAAAAAGTDTPHVTFGNLSPAAPPDVAVAVTVAVCCPDDPKCATDPCCQHCCGDVFCCSSTSTSGQGRRYVARALGMAFVAPWFVLCCEVGDARDSTTGKVLVEIDGGVRGLLSFLSVALAVAAWGVLAWHVQGDRRRVLGRELGRSQQREREEEREGRGQHHEQGQEQAQELGQELASVDRHPPQTVVPMILQPAAVTGTAAGAADVVEEALTGQSDKAYV